MQTYEECVQTLFEKRKKKGMKFGLEGIFSLLEKLGNPHKQCKYIHVAGSNGKGSVCTKIAYGLRGVYKKVGLYTSPHLITVRERIQVNEQPIGHKEFSSLFAEVLPLAEQNTLFETLTAAAFLHFAKENVDIAVLETGLGGRLDATNVVLPQVSVITSISLEHTHILGKTEEKIAWEKAGIMKEGRPVVIASGSTQEYLIELAEKLNCPFVPVELETEDYNVLNSYVAFAALGVLGIDCYLPYLVEKRPPCRFECVFLPNSLQKCIFDVAHNPDGIRKLLHTIAMQNFSHFPVCLLGVSEDKDLHTILGMIHEHFAAVVLVSDPNLPLKREEELVKAISLWDDAPFYVQNTFSSAVELALSFCDAQTPLVVTGSFYLMGPVKAALGFPVSLEEIKLNEAGLRFN